MEPQRSQKTPRDGAASVQLRILDPVSAFIEQALYPHISFYSSGRTSYLSNCSRKRELHPHSTYFSSTSTMPRTECGTRFFNFSEKCLQSNIESTSRFIGNILFINAMPLISILASEFSNTMPQGCNTMLQK